MPADIASTTAQRIVELNGFLTAYNSEAAASSDLKVKVDAGDNAVKALEERGYQSGGSPSSGNPNPFNPPGISNRK